MTSLDDDQLRHLLRAAGDALDPPVDGVARVLAAATPATPDEERTPVAARRRLHASMPLKVAASLLALTAVAGSVTAFTTREPPRTPATVRTTLGVPSGRLGLATQSEQADQGVSDAASATEQAGKNADWSEASQLSIAAHSSGAPSSELSTGVDATKVVATGTVRLTVPPARVRATVARIAADAVHDLGYVASSNAHTTPGGKASVATIVLRVPEARFASLVAKVQRLGSATSVVTSTANVTGQYVDYVARIAALESSRRQYLQILAKATSIPAILAVQAQINQIQSQIDQLAGQRNLLVNEAAYATLAISIDQGPRVAAHAGSGLVRSLRDSVGGFVAGAEWAVRAAGPALFALLCLVALWLVSRTGWRVARRRLLL